MKRGFNPTARSSGECTIAGSLVSAKSLRRRGWTSSSVADPKFKTKVQILLVAKSTGSKSTHLSCPGGTTLFRSTPTTSPATPRQVSQCQFNMSFDGSRPAVLASGAKPCSIQMHVCPCNVVAFLTWTICDMNQARLWKYWNRCPYDFCHLRSPGDAGPYTYIYIHILVNKKSCYIYIHGYIYYIYTHVCT